MTDRTSPRAAERGAALLVTMLVIVGLMSGAGVLVSIQLASTRAAYQSRAAMTALHCAEAGLATARPLVAASYPRWNAALANAAAEPSWLGAVDHDLDDDGIADFAITLVDNDDELAPLPGNRARDNDLTVFVVSTCTKYPETPLQVAELVRHNGGGNCYQAQLGGCGGNNNAN